MLHQWHTAFLLQLQWSSPNGLSKLWCLPRGPSWNSALSVMMCTVMICDVHCCTLMFTGVCVRGEELLFTGCLLHFQKWWTICSVDLELVPSTHQWWCTLLCQLCLSWAHYSGWLWAFLPHQLLTLMQPHPLYSWGCGSKQPYLQAFGVDHRRQKPSRWLASGKWYACALCSLLPLSPCYTDLPVFQKWLGNVTKRALKWDRGI